MACLIGTALATDFEPVLPAAPDPAAFDPQITVTPSESLVDGQVVTVDGRRFGFNSSGVLRECTLDRSLCGPETPFTSGRNGAFGPFDNPATSTDPNSVPVPFTVHTSFVPLGGGASVNCAPTACLLDAYADIGFQIRRACHHLSFGAADVTPCTQPTSATSSTSSSSSTAPPSSSSSTSSTTMAPTTSSPPVTRRPLPARQCADLRAERAKFNAQLDRRAASLSGAGRLPVAAVMLAALERYRDSANARYDRLLAGCPPV